MAFYVDRKQWITSELINWPRLRVYDNCNGAQWLSVADLVYLEGELNYTWLQFADGRRILVPYTIKRIEAKLPDAWFIRLHRHYLVNRQFIERVEYNSPRPIFYLVTGVALPVSRRRWFILRRQLDFQRPINLAKNRVIEPDVAYV
ncbi:response regulator receiver protein [Spirosoma sp. HMF4905]|uniref:Response regulator receiver protein n=1 Tax=Spirosoma arboris TaxID=2682092 RepID=A0A7K1SHA2_9BACT|nr:LytTR family DNA-binding domain-containing protein [Spirosoma arboris]MVM33192.1 response regulator receiver protein [Spirosoma arboris]